MKNLRDIIGASGKNNKETWKSYLTNRQKKKN